MQSLQLSSERVREPELAVKGRRIPVLDKGYVELVDWLGDDNRVVDAARVSFGKKSSEYSEEKNVRLINYLIRFGHTSPLEQVSFVFAIKLPIFVMRQLVRHRTARLNEISARYSVLPSDWYTPSPKNMRTQGKANKQGSGEVLSEGLATELALKIEHHSRESYELYNSLLNSGLSREMARVVLPVNMYTEIVWQIDLNNLLKFLDQRLHPHAQWEIQEYARAIYKCIEGIVPHCLNAWEAKKNPQT